MWSSSGENWAVQIVLHSVNYRDIINWRVSFEHTVCVSVLQLSVDPVEHVCVRCGPNCMGVKKLNYC